MLSQADARLGEEQVVLHSETHAVGHAQPRAARARADEHPRLDRMLSPDRNEHRTLLGLGFGFGLVMLLLSIAAFVTLRRSQTIQSTATTAVREHLTDARTIDQFQIQHERMGKILWDLLDFEVATPALRQRVESLGGEFEHIDTADKQDRSRLPQLRAAGIAFAAAAKQLLRTSPGAHRDAATRSLEQRYDDFNALATQVVKVQASSAAGLEREIQSQSEQLSSESLSLLGACLALSLIGAIVTIGLTERSFRTMRWQSEELNRVSWHMLEDQETAARRFAHEMHDELGQSLAGVKALVRSMAADGAKRENCLSLIDEAIRNVRELSQLLRPVVLDDLGLDAALRWLAERFEERTRIELTYVSSLLVRLPEQTETHFFRIAQEALTNVARHSGATRTRIELQQEGPRVTLLIEDNGKGLLADGLSAPSLGMVGMRARARQIGGELQVSNREQGGMRIEVWAPLQAHPQPPSVRHLATED